MTDQFFTTEFNRRIKFVPGYFEQNKIAVEYLDVHVESDSDRAASAGEKLPWGLPVKDLVEFSGMIQFMRRFGLLRHWGTSVDLGGAEGTVSALFRSMGIVKHATNVDLIDFSPRTGPGYFKEFVALYRNGSLKEKFEERIHRAKLTFDYHPDEEYQFGLFVGDPELAVIDRSIIGDVEAVSGKFDLVSAFSCLEHLDLDKALAKVRALLNPGGLFVCQNELWHWVYNSLGLMGHFPYAAARLTHADIERYLSLWHPTLIEGYRDRLSRIRQTQQRPTIKDWFDLGRKNGLRTVAVERIMPRRHNRVSPCPPALLTQPYFDHREILMDIHMFNPDVSVDDLMTYAIRIAMVPE